MNGSIYIDDIEEPTTGEPTRQFDFDAKHDAFRVYVSGFEHASMASTDNLCLAYALLPRLRSGSHA